MARVWIVNDDDWFIKLELATLNQFALLESLWGVFIRPVVAYLDVFKVSQRVFRLFLVTFDQLNRENIADQLEAFGLELLLLQLLQGVFKLREF